MPELDRIRARYAERDASAGLTGFWTLRNPVVLHLAQERERAALALLAAAGLSLAGLRVLDVGCGHGREFTNLLRWGASPEGMAGVDLMRPRLQAARAQSRALLAQASADALPFADASFDVVCQHVVFSSVVDDALKRRSAAEMLRVLKPGGHVLWYDIARQRSRDPQLRALPRAEVQSLLPLDWRWRRLHVPLGLLRRVGAVAGEAGMLALTNLGLARTHLLGLGRKP